MRTRNWIWLFVIAGGLQSCSYLQLRRPVRISPEDWTLFGGSMERTNVAHIIIVPPLSMVWEYDASAGFSSYSAVVADSLLFIGNLKGEVHAIQVATGKGVGSYSFGSAVVGTPVIEKDRMFVALARPEESLVAYDLLKGRIRWRASVGEIETSPLMIGNRLYVTALNGSLVCVEKNSGEVVWRYDVPTHGRAKLIHSSPASDGNVIVFGCDDGILYAVGVDDGKLRWSAPAGASIIASPSIEQGKVFLGALDGSFYSFDLTTGKQIWKHPLGSKIYSSQTVGLHQIYVGTAGRTIYCLDESTGATIWKANTNGVINAAPLLSGSILYVGCIDKTLYAYNAQSGENVWEYKTEGRIKTMPVIWKNYLFLFVEDRSVIAFKNIEKQ